MMSGPAAGGCCTRDQRGRGDSGSLLVETIVIVPVVFMFAIVSLVFGRVSTARQEAVEAARAGAQAAAVMPDASQATMAATSNAEIVASNAPRSCAHASVSVDTSSFRPGGWIRVSVTCVILLADVAVPGIPGSATATASAVAPIDTYRSVP